MTKEQIKTEVRKIQEASSGRNIYGMELKKAIIGTLPQFKTQQEMAKYYNIRADRLNKWKRGFEGVVKARTVSHGRTGIRYAISTKIEACEQVLKYGRTVNSVATSFGVTHNTLSIWVADYQDGKYTLENVVQVSRKKFRTYDLIVKDIEKKENELNTLKEEAKEALKKEFDEKMAVLEGK